MLLFEIYCPNYWGTSLKNAFDQTAVHINSADNAIEIIRLACI